MLLDRRLRVVMGSLGTALVPGIWAATVVGVRTGLFESCFWCLGIVLTMARSWDGALRAMAGKCRDLQTDFRCHVEQTDILP